MGKYSIYPELTKEKKEELFKEYNDFFIKYTNHKTNNIRILENVYKGIDDNRKMKMYIRNNKYSISLPLLVTMLFFIPAVLFKCSFFWSGILSSILIALLSLFFWIIYLDNDNKKDAVLLDAYEDLRENEIIEANELQALKSLLSEGEMIELLKHYNKNIPVSKVIELIDYYTLDFKNWEARQLYLDI